MLQLDLKSRLPIYEQLVEKIKSMIISDVLKKDEQLPSVRTLAAELSINPNTIQKAYRELERQGYLYSVSGKGNFVSPIDKNEDSEKIRELKTEIVRIITEGLYLGMKKSDLISIIEEIDERINGGE